MTNKINGIDVSEYFVNHYDNSGKLYAVEYKGNPLELQNAIKRLQKENDGFKSLNDFYVQKIEVLQEENEGLKADLKGETEQCQKWYQLETDKHFQMLKYEQALEEIRNEIGDLKDINKLINLQKILDIINEALNDRN